MPYDMNRCPQSEDEFREYFFTLIQRSIGTDANDWNAVVRKSNIPAGYGPGIRADATFPLFGLTQQWSNGPKARIFLPSDTADDNGYFTRCIQYISDKPGGSQGSEFVWDWFYVAGHAYVPVQGAEAPPVVPPGTTPPVTGGMTPADVQRTVSYTHLRAHET